MEVPFSELKGKTLVKVQRHPDDELEFVTDAGEQYVMHHEQDCCEDVVIEDICGDLSDLIGSPIVMAEAVVHENENPEGVEVPEFQDSFTWTFYKLATAKGYVTIRWYGASNGYYSEAVSFTKL